MAYGLSFVTNTGKTFIMDEVQPIVYVGKYSVDSGSRTISVAGLSGLATLEVELVDWNYTRAGLTDVMFTYSLSNSTKGSITINVGSVGGHLYTGVFAVYARFS